MAESSTKRQRLQARLVIEFERAGLIGERRAINRAMNAVNVFNDTGEEVLDGVMNCLRDDLARVDGQLAKLPPISRTE